MKGDYLRYMLPKRGKGFIMGARFWKIETRRMHQPCMPINPTTMDYADIAASLTRERREGLAQPTFTIIEPPSLRAAVIKYIWPKGEPAFAGHELVSNWHGGITPGNMPAPGIGLFAKSLVGFSSELVGVQPSHLEYVWGTVALWGDVIEHARGWRATHAYPLSINNQAMAKEYGCDYASDEHSPRTWTTVPSYSIHKRAAIMIKALQDCLKYEPENIREVEYAIAFLRRETYEEF